MAINNLGSCILIGESTQIALKHTSTTQVVIYVTQMAEIMNLKKYIESIDHRHNKKEQHIIKL